MPGAIKSDEIYQAKILQGLIDQLDSAKKANNDLNASLRESARILKSNLQDNKANDTASIKTQNQAIKEANQLFNQKLALEKQAIVIETQSSKLRQQLIREQQQSTKATQEQTSAYKEQSARLNELRNQYKDLAVQNQGNSKEARTLLREITALDSKLKNVDATVGQNYRNVGNYSKALSSLKSMVTGVISVFGLFTGIRFFAGLEIKLSSLQLALRNVMKTQDNYANSMKFLTNLSKDYGQDLLVLTDTYKNFIASSESSNLKLSERNRIYESIIKSGSSLALSNEQIQGSLLAVSQMFSKGTVQAEELRGQLGERLPGAFGLMAKAMGVTEMELGKLLKDGKVLASEALPLLANELEKTYGANAQQNLKTVGGAWNVLKTNIMLYLNEANKGAGITEKIAGAIKFLANNLGSIGSVLGKVIFSFAVYKTSLLAINAAEYIRNGNLKEAIKGMFSMSKSTDDATKSTGRFGNALKSIGWMALIALLTETALKIYDVASGMEDMRLKMEAYHKSVENGDQAAKDFISDMQKENNLREVKIKSLLKEGSITDAQAKKRREDIEAENILKLKTQRQLLNEDKARLLIEKEQEEKDLKALNDRNKKANEFRILPGKAGMIQEEDNTRAIEKIRATRNAIADINVQLKAYDAEIISIQTSSPDSILPDAGKIKSLAREIEEERNKQIDFEKDRLKAEANTNAKFRIIELAEVKATEQEKAALELEIRANLLLELKQIEDDYIEKRLQDQQRITDKYNADVKANREAIEKIDADKAEASGKEKQRLSDEQEENYNNRRDDTLEQIEHESQIRKLKIVSSSATEEDKQKLLKESHEQQLREEIEFLKRAYNTTKEEKAKILSLEIELAESENKKTLEKTKLNYQQISQVIKLAADYFIRQSERKIAQIDKEIAMHEKQYSMYEQLAIQGNINAQQSLAREQNDIVEANQKKAAESKRIERIKLGESAVTAYGANSANKDVKNPLLKTFTDITLLTQFINSLPAFYGGTETTVSDALGSPLMNGKDGHVIRVDGKEKILNPQLSAMTGDMTTGEIAKVASDFYTGRMIRLPENFTGAKSTNTNYASNEEIISRLDKLINVTAGQSESNDFTGKLVGDVIKYTHTKTKGNSVFKNQHIIRP